MRNPLWCALAGALLFSVARADTLITADATDDIGVRGVQFMIDYVPIGVEDQTVPYAIMWPNESDRAGWHVIGARATDVDGNISYDSIPVLVKH